MSEPEAMVKCDQSAGQSSHSASTMPTSPSSSSSSTTSASQPANAAMPPPCPPSCGPASPSVSTGGNDGDSSATTQHRESSRSQTPPTSPSSCEGGQRGKAKTEEHDPHANIKPSYFYPMDPSDPNSHLDESAIPVFEPTMSQFADFYKFCEAINDWGMKTGIVKIVPPKEWVDSLPSIRAPDVAQQEKATGAAEGSLPTLEGVRIRSAIAQHFGPAFKPGLWRQTNITRPAKIWNVKQWSDVCREMSGPTMSDIHEHIKIRKEMESGSSKDDKNGIRTRSGRGRQSGSNPSATAGPSSSTKRRRKTIEKADKAAAAAAEEEAAVPSLSQESSSASVAAAPAEEDGVQPVATSSSSSQPKVKAADLTTPEEWSHFDQRLAWLKEWISPGKKGEEEEGKLEHSLKPSDWTPMACREIEGEYWRGLNFGKPPMYGADLKGTLFTPATKSWNVNSLDNLLTRLKLRRKIAGVTDPYLYFGMWRATFAWHVEDMDLYSINYIHFGAPKQWYAIPQRDRLRFETALASAFPGDARRCSQFMRHKSFLASPTFLAANNIRPLKLVQHAQEFVITYPFGYHSGYNLGFNCAESVNFALDSWLDIGRKAKACECEDAQQSVKMDVDALLQESEELEQAERRKEERERARREREELASDEHLRKEAAKARRAEKKRLKEQRAAEEGDGDDEEGSERKPQSAKPKAKQSGGLSMEHLPCVFCPSSLASDLVPIPGESGEPSTLAAHRFCANSVPECWVAEDGTGNDEVKGFYTIAKARWGLKCSVCPAASAKYGCSIQCTFGSCTKAAHPTCAAHDVSGWMMDMLPANEADKLEGRGAYAAKSKKNGAKKKSSGPASSPPAGGAEAAEHSQASSPPLAPAELPDSSSAPERMVVLCRGHNPSAKQAEQLRKARHLRECAMRLLPGSRIKVKSNGGIWETTLVALKESSNPLSEGDALVEDAKGPRRVIKWSRIVFDAEIVAAASQATEELEKQESQHSKQQQKATSTIDREGDSCMAAPAPQLNAPLPPRSRLLNDAEFATAKADRSTNASATTSAGRLLGGAAPSSASSTSQWSAAYYPPRPAAPQHPQRQARSQTAPADAHLSSSRVIVGSTAHSTINRPVKGATPRHPYAMSKGAGYGYGASSFGHHSLAPKQLKRLPAVLTPLAKPAPTAAAAPVAPKPLALQPRAGKSAASTGKSLPPMSSLLSQQQSRPDRPIAPIPRGAVGGAGASGAPHRTQPLPPAAASSEPCQPHPPPHHPSYGPPSHPSPSYMTAPMHASMAPSPSAGAPQAPQTYHYPPAPARYDGARLSGNLYYHHQHPHGTGTGVEGVPPQSAPPSLPLTSMTRPYYTAGQPSSGSSSGGMRPSYDSATTAVPSPLRQQALPRIRARDEGPASAPGSSSGSKQSLAPSYRQALPSLPPPSQGWGYAQHHQQQPQGGYAHPSYLPSVRGGASGNPLPPGPGLPYAQPYQPAPSNERHSSNPAQRRP